MTSTSKTVKSLPTLCGCGTEVKDVEYFRHHLIDEHGLWKATWKAFCRKRLLEEDEDLANPTSISDTDDAGEIRSYKRRKLTKTGDKFIEWSPPASSDFPQSI